MRFRTLLVTQFTYDIFKNKNKKTGINMQKKNHMLCESLKNTHGKNPAEKSIKNKHTKGKKQKKILI